MYMYYVLVDPQCTGGIHPVNTCSHPVHYWSTSCVSLLFSNILRESSSSQSTPLSLYLCMCQLVCQWYVSMLVVLVLRIRMYVYVCQSTCTYVMHQCVVLCCSSSRTLCISLLLVHVSRDVTLPLHPKSQFQQLVYSCISPSLYVLASMLVVCMYVVVVCMYVRMYLQQRKPVRMYLCISMLVLSLVVTSPLYISSCCCSQQLLLLFISVFMFSVGVTPTLSLTASSMLMLVVYVCSSIRMMQQ